MGSQHYDFLIIGAGIFGLSTAIELSKRNYSVAILNPDSIPHHLAASTDISKAVRMEYGSDKEYFRMAETCISRWKDWNDLLGTELYHEVGFLMLTKNPLDAGSDSYEWHSLQNLIQAGYDPKRFKREEICDHFPALKPDTFAEAVYNPAGGYVTSGLAIEKLADYARSIGVEVLEGQTVSSFIIANGTLQGVKTKESCIYKCGHAIVAAGVYTPLLLPELQAFMKCTGHPVFWLKPSDSEPFKVPNLPVFMADIAKSGWYGFPFLPKHGIVKVAKHTKGIVVHPEEDDRYVEADEIADMRSFLSDSFPMLARAPLVYTRRCLYTDTLDGHFWIDNHPEIKGLTVSSGGSGHGMKMGPVIGEMTADVAEGGSHQYSNRYNWRVLSADTIQSEEARFVIGGRI